MKALRSFDSFRGGDFRSWLLAIVRNTCFTWLHRRKGSQSAAGERAVDVETELAADEATYDPQAIAMRAADAQLVHQAIEQLSPVVREVIVLREMQGLSYKEIGKIAGVPIGTVMSRLARGRSQLQSLLMEMDQAEPRRPAQEGAQ